MKTYICFCENLEHNFLNICGSNHCFKYLKYNITSNVKVSNKSWKFTDLEFACEVMYRANAPELLCCVHFIMNVFFAQCAQNEYING
jgi:hypothetical protein